MLNQNKFFVLGLVLVSLIGCSTNTFTTDVPEDKGSITYFSLEDVSLTTGKFKHAQDLDEQYLLELNADRLLAPYLKEAGLEPKAPNYPNWENTGLDGHIGGHYVSALSIMYAATGDAEIQERLIYMLNELQRCQQANGNGYLSGVPNGKEIWEEIKNGTINAGGFSLNNRWVPLYNIHKIYAGLNDAYTYTGSEQAKEMLIALTDWMINLVADLSDEQIQQMLVSEHGGLNEVFANVYAITGSDKYLKLAKQFSHNWLLNPLLERKDNLTGMHANTQIPKVIGFERIGQLENDSTWNGAASFFWDEVVNKRSVSIGGNSAYEHFHPEDNFSVMITGTQGPETCNTYNMLKLTKMLYQDTGNSSYIDYYERALYNHILSSQNPETGGLVYFTQMRPGHYRVYSQPETSFWCCVGSGIENHGKYGEMIYAHTNESLFVNLFIPSELSWKEKGVKLIQTTDFPAKEAVKLTIETEQPTAFILKIRKPEWAKDKGAITVNGNTVDITADDDYVSVYRNWENGDVIDIKFAMQLSAEQLPDDSNYYSILYGPIVLATKTDTTHLDGLFADASRGGHIAHGEIDPIDKMPVLVSKPDEIIAKITKEKSDDLRFKIGSLSYTEEKATDSMELMPFYELHESRYIIYFPQATKEELTEMKRKQQEREEVARVLQEKTVDLVQCGEQQPESDHFISQKETWTGYEFERHWREGGGFFSYKMVNEMAEARFVYLSYLDVNPNRACEIYLGGVKIGEITANGGNEQPLAEKIFDIPKNLQDFKDTNVKVKAKDGIWMPKIVEVRLLKEKL